MKTNTDYEPKSDQEKDSKLIPDEMFGESAGGGDEERPPDVVVEN